MDEKAVRNQKVFIGLRQVLELQKEIERLAAAMGSSAVEHEVSRSWGRAMLRAAEILQLPINLSVEADTRLRRKF